MSDLKFADGVTLDEELADYDDPRQVVYLTSILGHISKETAVLEKCHWNASARFFRSSAALAVAESDMAEMQRDLENALAVAKELNASNERLLERVTIAERRLRQAHAGEVDEELATLREQLAAANRKLEDVDEINSHAARQAGELRDRAQRAEAELATVKPKLQRALAELATERRRAETLEAEVETSEAEFTALKEGPCDASA